MIICTLQTLKAFNSKGEIIQVPQGTYISLPYVKAHLLIDLGLARMVDLFDSHNALHHFRGYQGRPYVSRTVH